MTLTYFLCPKSVKIRISRSASEGEGGWSERFAERNGDLQEERRKETGYRPSAAWCQDAGVLGEIGVRRVLGDACWECRTMRIE